MTTPFPLPPHQTPAALTRPPIRPLAFVPEKERGKERREEKKEGEERRRREERRGGGKKREEEEERMGKKIFPSFSVKFF